MSVRQCEAPGEAADGGDGPADANKGATTPRGAFGDGYGGYEGVQNSPDSKGSTGSGSQKYLNQYLQ